MESVLKKEIIDLGYEVSLVEDGRVTFIGDEEAVFRANIGLRTAERILIKVGSFHAETFEELFQGTKAIPWEEYIPENGKFWVAKAASVKSALFSPSDIQSIMKKAMVDRMSQHYGITHFPEDGVSFPSNVPQKELVEPEPIMGKLATSLRLMSSSSLAHAVLLPLLTKLENQTSWSGLLMR